MCDSHDHQHNKTNKKGALPIETTKKIDELLGFGSKSNDDLLRAIRQAGLPEITVSQLNSYKSRTKYKRIGKPSLTLNDLKDWCESRKEIPENMDKVFCGGFDYQLDDDDKVKSLHVFVTTKRLIQLTLKCNYNYL